MNKGELLRNLALERAFLRQRIELIRIAANIVRDYELQDTLTGSQISGLVREGEGCWEKIKDYLNKRAEKCGKDERWRKRYEDIELKQKLTEFLKDPHGELVRKVDEVAKNILDELRKAFPLESFVDLTQDEKLYFWRRLKQGFLHYLLACYNLKLEEVQKWQELY